MSDFRKIISFYLIIIAKIYPKMENAQWELYFQTTAPAQVVTSFSLTPSSYSYCWDYNSQVFISSATFSSIYNICGTQLGAADGIDVCYQATPLAPQFWFGLMKIVISTYPIHPNAELPEPVQS
ncbi:MAG: hypothetical protein K9I71_13155 [Ignavibacteriales bacterium]|nr:hypothetical protein [Ignavibacteriales bacterium]MCF8317072.1 hypothetical protein [Ignavibacteriales bacterium]MCF8438659.1 hypothetical protein [Ignavibacteriales bacterium]